MGVESLESNGIVRQLDDLGRLVLPIELRWTLGIKVGDSLAVLVRDDREIVLSPVQPGCWLCGATDDLAEPYRGRRICRDCEAGMAAAASQPSASRTEAKRRPTARATPRRTAPTPDAASKGEAESEPTFVVRRLDRAGRIVLPDALRRKVRIDFGDTLALLARPGGELALAKHRPTCLLCGEPGDLLPFHGQRVCRGCAVGVAQAAAALEASPRKGSVKEVGRHGGE